MIVNEFIVWVRDVVFMKFLFLRCGNDDVDDDGGGGGGSGGGVAAAAVAAKRPQKCTQSIKLCIQMKT